MSNLSDKQFGKAKRKKTMSYQYDDAGVTFCPKCHKAALQEAVDEPWRSQIVGQTPTVKYNTDFQTGDLETCSGGCGRTIYGRKGTYE